MSTAQIIIGLVVVVIIIAIAVWMMTRTQSPSPVSGASTGAGGGLWSSIFGIGGSAVSAAGGIIDQQTQQHSDPVLNTSEIWS